MERIVPKPEHKHGAGGRLPSTRLELHSTAVDVFLSWHHWKGTL